MKDIIKGYKVFNPDWTCRGYQFSCPGVFEEDVIPEICNRGFHFCKKAVDCFNYYNFEPNNKVAEVIALGEVITEGDKSCTNKLQIVREIPWAELLTIVNTGNCNTGNRNTGNYNTGNCNTGNRNTGNYNTGNRNTGNYNTGDYNTGDRNTGDRNTGNRNTGDRNTGNYNTGNCNTGDRNTGNCNTGNRNTGDHNTGDWNAGNWNTGDCNTGNRNTGDRNTGNCNTGDWNTSDYSAGCFCTVDPELLAFNQPSGWKMRDWLCSEARKILMGAPRLKFISLGEMTEAEKIEYPEAETTGGYLKKASADEMQNWWDNLSVESQRAVKSIPNFDSKIFKQITGIDVTKTP